jgi:AcrR family transcriptional regulator
MITPDSSEAKPRYHHGDLRAALLRAGEAELGAAGIEGFSLRRVAKRAGVSHAAPAHHFGDARGLLTALAAEGFRLFVAAMEAAERAAPPEPEARLTAAGLGYIDFATEHTAVFRLMFGSDRPDFDDPDLGPESRRGFEHLVALVSRVIGRPAMADAAGSADVVGTWAIAHGLADLLVSNRMKAVQAMPPDRRREFIAGLISRMRPQS